MRAAALITTSMVLAGAARAQTAGFWLIGFPPGGQSSGVSGLTRDGHLAVGATFVPAGPIFEPAYRWTAAAGRVDFGNQPGFPTFNPPASVNNDGSVIAGWASGSGWPHHAYRRAGNAPPQDLGALPNYPFSEATGISGDGSTVVGRSRDLQSDYLGEAFRWTESGGMQGLGYLRPGGTFSRANGISRDGTTIVGVSQSSGPGNPTEGFVWTESTGMQALPGLVPGGSFEPRAVNADGSVVVGQYGHAVRWAGGPVQDLGTLPGTLYSVANAVSDDGAVLGGNSVTGSNLQAFVWTPSTGMLSVGGYLGQHGVLMPATFQPWEVLAVSGDGLTVGGYGLNTATGLREGFVATVPSPGPLLILLAPLIAHRRRSSFRTGPSENPRRISTVTE
jgi:hypothetical protein